MRYSDDIIEEVRQKNDIVDVVSQYVKLTRKGSSYFGLCPFHNEKTPSFSVTPGKQMYYCFGCGAGGNVFNFIMEYENYTFGEALKHLADRAGVELPKIEYSREVREKVQERTELLEINKQAAQYFYYQLRRQVVNIMRRAVSYLPHYQRQGDLAYGGHRGAEHIEGEQPRIFFIVRQEPFEHPAVAAGVVPGQTNTPNQAVIYQNYTTFISL